MERFNSFEHDTLLAFLPFIEQKISTAYRKAILADNLPPDVYSSPDVKEAYIRAFLNFPRNIEPLKKNRPGALTSQQWDELLFIFFTIVHDADSNMTLQPMFGKEAGKCYQILLAKRAERLEPFRNQPEPEAARVPDRDILDAAALRALNDQRDRSFNRGMICQVLAFVLILAFTVIILVDHQLYLAYFLLPFAALAILSAIRFVRLTRKAAKRIELHEAALNREPGGERVLKLDHGGKPVETVIDTSTRRFEDAVKDPPGYCLPDEPVHYADECLAEARKLAAAEPVISSADRYLDAALLRFDLLGIGRCMKESITGAGCRLFLTTCCLASEMVRENTSEANREKIAGMIEKTSREVMAICLETIEGNSIMSGQLFAGLPDYVHTFDLFLNLYEIYKSDAYLRFIDERIDLIKVHLAIAGKSGLAVNLPDMQRISHYEQIAEGTLRE